MMCRYIYLFFATKYWVCDKFMSNLKKSFLGGYKRSSVDAEIDRLGRMIEEAETGKK